jgi:hypothetical protein
MVAAMTAPEALALQLLLDGQCLAETTERLQADGHDPNAVWAWFSRWISTGMIAVASEQPDAD